MKKAFKLSEYGYANTMGVFLAVMIAIISFAQFKILGKRRRILKKGASDETNTKETHHCLYSDFNDHFAPFNSLVHFPFYWILTGAFKSQPDTIMIPPQWCQRHQPWKTSSSYGTKPSPTMVVE